MAPGRIVVIGEAAEVELYALAGAQVVVAADSESVRTAWTSYPRHRAGRAHGPGRGFVELEPGADERPLVGSSAAERARSAPAVPG